MYQVNKPYLPSIRKYKKYIDGIYSNNWLTNNGPLVRELETRMGAYLGVENLVLVSSGTIALELAYHLLELRGKVLTTPYSFVATTSSLVWSGIQPEFVDINKKSFNMDLALLAREDLDSVNAIVPVHIFGNPCEVEAIDSLAKKHGFKVIYDAAHAFSVTHKKNSVLNFGDISTLSLHATKICHSIEGGALVIKDNELCEKARRLINFGYDNYDKIHEIGINAKMSEFHAAMGLAVLDDMDLILERRRGLFLTYRKELADVVSFQKIDETTSWNYAYMPILFKTEKELLHCMDALLQNKIFPRRYFKPTLDSLHYSYKGSLLSNAESISNRVLCLPMYVDLVKNDIKRICRIIRECLENFS